MTTNFLDTLTRSMPTVPLPATLSATVEAASQSLRRSEASVADWMRPEVSCLIAALNVRDAATAEHSKRVAKIALWLADQLDCNQRTRQIVCLGGLLHDVGKLGVDDVVLRKDGELTAEERRRARKHPELGCAIVKDIESLAHFVPIVLYHHEAWDGSGYPFGLRGNQIPLGARICALADALDAMGNDRPYRKALPDDQVDVILSNGAGKQWDPKVVDTYLRNRFDLRSTNLATLGGQIGPGVPEMHMRPGRVRTAR